MEERKFTILGETGSGKTCYLLGMYNEMTMGIAGYSTVIEDKEVESRLADRYNKLADKTLGANRFPKGTAQEDTKTVTFNLQYANDKILPFHWVDYPGGFLDPTLRDTNNEKYQAVETSINESDMLFICIDGSNLVKGSVRKKIRKVRDSCVKRINPYLGRRANNGKPLPPIGLLITKWDLCKNYNTTTDLRDIIRGAFDSLFAGNNFIAIIPVSLGETLQQNNYTGELDPINIHIPILLGFNFALIDFLKTSKLLIEKNTDLLDATKLQLAKEQNRWDITRTIFGGISPEKLREMINSLNQDRESIRQIVGHFRESLAKIQKELQVVDSIFWKSHWLNEKEIEGFWRESQSIAEYNF